MDSGEMETEVMGMSSREQWMQETLSRLMEVDPDRIEIAGSFGDMGIDSLIGLRFVREMQEEFGFEIELDWLYDNPSIRELSSFIDDRFGAAGIDSQKNA